MSDDPLNPPGSSDDSAEDDLMRLKDAIENAADMPSVIAAFFHINRPTMLRLLRLRSQQIIQAVEDLAFTASLWNRANPEKELISLRAQIVMNNDNEVTR